LIGRFRKFESLGQPGDLRLIGVLDTGTLQRNRSRMDAQRREARAAYSIRHQNSQGHRSKARAKQHQQIDCILHRLLSSATGVSTTLLPVLFYDATLHRIPIQKKPALTRISIA